MRLEKYGRDTVGFTKNIDPPQLPAGVVGNSQIDFNYILGCLNVNTPHS